jgi:type IV pilus assembly protein PilA
MMHSSAKRFGFTLVELFVVIVVVGILVAVSIPKFTSTKGRAYITAMKSDLRNVAAAQAAFYAESSKYASDLSALAFTQSPGTLAPTIVTGTGYWSATNGHAQLPNTSCGIAIGTTNPVVSGAGEGEPACRP